MATPTASPFAPVPINFGGLGTSAPTTPAAVPTTAPKGQTSTTAPAATPTPTPATPVAVNSSKPAATVAANAGAVATQTQAQIDAANQARIANQGKPGYDVFGNPVVGTPLSTGGADATNPSTPLTPEQQIANQPSDNMTFIYDAQGNRHEIGITDPIPMGYSKTNPMAPPTSPVEATAQTNLYTFKQFQDGTYGRYDAQGNYNGVATAQDFTDAQQEVTVSQKLQQAINGTLPLNASQQAQIAGLQSTWTTAIAQQKIQNANNVGAITDFTSLHGGNGQQDTPGVIADAITKGTNIVNDMNTKMLAAVAQMTAGFNSDNLTLLKSAYDSYNSLQETRKTAIDKMVADTTAAQKIQNDQIDQQARDTAIGAQITSGVTDPIAIEAALTAKGIKVTAQQVSDTLTNLQPNAKSLTDLMKTITANGAPANIVKAVGSAKTLNDAYIAAGTYAAGGTGIIAQYNLYKAQGGLQGFDDWTQAYYQAKSQGTTQGKLNASTPTGSAGTLQDAISGQESGGSYTTTNADSGALGKYQIMPVHLADIGLDGNNPADVQKFLASPVLQDNLYAKIISDLQTKYNGNQDQVIAAYYGGDAAAQIVGTPAGDKPQGGGKYPSINDYVKQVEACMTWNVNDATAPPSGSAGNTPYGITGRTPNDIWQSAITLSLDKSATPQKFLGGLSGSSGAGMALKNAITNKSAALMTAAGVNQATLQQQFTANSSSINKQITYMNDVQRNMSSAHDGLTQVMQKFSGLGINANDSTYANTKLNDLSKSFTDSGDIRAYQAALTEIGNEYSQVFSRGGQRNIAADARAQSIIDGNITLSDLQKIGDELQAQGQIVIGASISQVANITTGGGAGEVAKFLAYVNNQPDAANQAVMAQDTASQTHNGITLPGGAAGSSGSGGSTYQGISLPN